jgi:hypothetical protein
VHLWPRRRADRIGLPDRVRTREVIAVSEDKEKPKRPPHDNHDPIPVPEVPEDERDERIHRSRIHEDVKGGSK